MKLDRELSELDRFVLDFVAALGKTSYVLVSGYVSILFGRSRSSEDINIIIPVLTKSGFLALFDVLTAAGFESITAGRETAHEYISAKTAIQFARKGQVLPNMEVKFATTYLSQVALKDRITVELNNRPLFISPIELQILYKQRCLKSDKDIEDARHLEIVFERALSAEKLKRYGALIELHGC
ncbi:hypothetical protein HY493_04485 [Candidatus Woesearchaeota archaeon]|nr:hypothetical protein [Candidatus Woesearchaeota archaeon]